MENKRFKIAIGIPSGSLWHAEMAISLCGLASTTVKHHGVCILSQRGSHISKQRNDLVERAKAIDADYLLQIDSDMSFPPDALLRLLAHDKDIVGATYNKRVPPYETLGKAKGVVPAAGAPVSGLVDMLFMPGGFMLTKLSVYEKLPYPWYFELYDDEQFSDRCRSEDYSFCQKSRDNGFDVWCDLDLTTEMIHWGEQPVTCVRPPSAATAEVLPYEPAFFQE